MVLTSSSRFAATSQQIQAVGGVRGRGRGGERDKAQTTTRKKKDAVVWRRKKKKSTKLDVQLYDVKCAVEQGNVNSKEKRK